MYRLTLGLLCVGFLAATIRSFALTNSSSVVDGGGSISSNASFQCIMSIGQAEPVEFNQNAANQKYSGFLNTFVLNPQLDADADGIVDENDPDDDNDNLLDTTELAGEGFDPPTSTNPFSADSDGDGAKDGQESVAGTNPQDANSLLEIVRAELVGDTEVVEWTSRSGKQYEVYRTTTAEDLSASPIVSGPFTAIGGIAPWFDTNTSVSNAVAGTNSFYGVRVIP